MPHQAHSRGRRMLLALATCAFTVGVFGPAAAAYAAPVTPKIEVSADGVHWQANLSDPLFDPAIMWVPGDSRVAEFLVRNLGGSDAWLSVAAERYATLHQLAETNLALSVRVDGGEWAALGSEAQAARLSLTHSGVAATPASVELRAEMPGGTGNAAQLGTARFEVTVNLQEAIEPGPHPGVGGEAANLAGTGAGPFTGWWIAAAALGVGTALLLGAARERRAIARQTMAGSEHNPGGVL